MRKAQAGTILAIVIFVIIITFLIAFIPGLIGLTEGTNTAKSFKGGKEALALSFVNLPSSRAQNQDFDIEVEAKNIGEHDIKAGEVRVILNNAQTFGVSNAVTTNPQIIRNVEEGGEAIFIYPNAKYTSSVLSSEIPQTLSVGVCYPYQTISVVKNVCLAPTLTDELCEVRGEKETESSGAPVHLISFKQVDSVYNTGEEYVELVVDLEFMKVGSGEIYYSKEAKCSSLTAEAFDNIKISSIKLGTVDIDILTSCETDIVSLSKDGTGSVRCTLRQKGIKTDAIGVLTVKMDYLYNHQLKESIRVTPS